MSSQSTLILDGGMGRELERIGAPFSQPFWSAQALMEAPNIVADVHQNFIKAGAKVITTNSYAVVPAHIGDDLFNERGNELIELSAQLARQEADKVESKDVLVAGCIPPVFGSYRPDSFNKDKAPALFSAFFEKQVKYADIFLAETISSIEETQIIIDTYKKLGQGKPLWLAFTLQECFDETTEPLIRSGEKLDNAIKVAIEGNVAQAILLNCCTVEDISAAFKLSEQIHKADQSIKFGAYANVFAPKTGKRSPTNDLSELREDITPQAYLDYSRQWINGGASIIGGCCGIGPEYIELLSRELIQ